MKYEAETTQVEGSVAYMRVKTKVGVMLTSRETAFASSPAFTASMPQTSGQGEKFHLENDHHMARRTCETCS